MAKSRNSGLEKMEQDTSNILNLELSCKRIEKRKNRFQNRDPAVAHWRQLKLCLSVGAPMCRGDILLLTLWR
ncbi:MAG TPA: hypothetical protein DIV79_15915, partial [Opitutae bacterium]|nr:hypothetical protein [Opitutae bacterium]